MPRGAANEAKHQLKTTNQIGSGALGQGQNIYNSLEPQLESMATNPQGFSPGDMSAMQTKSDQALGGATGGLTGQANLQAARTRNSAGYAPALDSASRGAGQQQSQNDLAIQAANAQVKQQQQQSALSSLGSLYGTQIGEGESFYGMAPGEINAQTAASPGWAQTLGGLVSSFGSLGQGVGAAAKGFQ